MSGSVEISGLQAVLDAIDANMASKAKRIEQAIQGAGIDTQADAKKACPVKTGRLRASIQYKRIAQYEYVVSTNVNYALVVEAGMHGQRAQPYLYPSFLKNSRKLMDELQKIAES